jgi:putative transposase
MSQSFSCLFYHWIFATKLRQRVILPGIETHLDAYMGGIVRNLGGHLLAANGTEDHRHLALRLPPTEALALSINKVKSNSTRWLRQDKGMRLFGWQNGYAAFTVSPSAMPTVIEYIRNQKRHHCKITFREELLRLFEKHGIEPDQKAFEKFCMST